MSTAKCTRAGVVHAHDASPFGVLASNVSLRTTLRGISSREEERMGSGDEESDLYGKLGYAAKIGRRKDPDAGDRIAAREQPEHAIRQFATTPRLIQVGLCIEFTTRKWGGGAHANYVLVRAWPTRAHPGDVDGGEACGGSGRGDDDAEAALVCGMVRPRFCFKARANNRRITGTKRLDDRFFEGSGRGRVDRMKRARELFLLLRRCRNVVDEKWQRRGDGRVLRDVREISFECKTKRRGSSLTIGGSCVDTRAHPPRFCSALSSFRCPSPETRFFAALFMVPHRAREAYREPGEIKGDSEI
ncbi:hypothetical protein ALC62_07612 [Cyphomyrmex costatus]|uniref:Uncharacterized protein n=1 Tax=Cyphomyrmex costatus TaxID=456900 RepID=A0A195CLR3_9HYME|nr:hypothetical protein ALC62_07612 [Cyphomyrmex costatus]